jgi:Protein of unknown function (DUF2815)
MAENSKLKTGVVRLSYVHLIEPGGMEGTEPKYSAVLLIPKKDKTTIAAIQAEIDIAFNSVKSKLKAKQLKSWHNPLQDGDEATEKGEEYANHFFINAKSPTKVALFDADLNPVQGKEEIAELFYSGVYAKAIVKFFGFDKGDGGVGCSLNGLKFVKDGEPLSGGRATADDFADDDDDDFL